MYVTNLQLITWFIKNKYKLNVFSIDCSLFVVEIKIHDFDTFFCVIFNFSKKLRWFITIKYILIIK